jgi:hypothetical protein
MMPGMRLALAALLFSLSLASHAHANPDDADTRGIRQAALDYIEGWYQGDVKRMTRAVHPELAKRIVRSENGVSHLDQMGASRLIQNVRGGGGKETPAARQQKEITILDHFQNAASVKIVASDWIDYLHLAKVDGRWVIVNVLWEIKAPTQTHKH